VQVDRKVIESSLVSKGFVRHDTHHKYFYHEIEGQRTGIHTYTSHGSKYKTYRDPLLGRMKRELRLDSLGQVVDLCRCPITGDGYNEILRKKGQI